MTDSRAVRGGSLLLLGVVATLGAQATSAQARTLKNRLDASVSANQPAVHFINHGGTVSGAISCSGLATGGGSITTSGGTINTSGGSITCGSITSGHISATQIGPGGDRAALGAGATLAQVQARCDFLLAQLEGANICY